MGLAMEGGLERLASGSSGPISSFHDPVPPKGERAARLSARLARPIGSRGAGKNGAAPSSSTAASHGVEVASGAGVNGTGPSSSAAARHGVGIAVAVGAGATISSRARNSSNGMTRVRVLRRGDAVESPLAAPRVVSASQNEGLGSLLDLLGLLGGVASAGRTFGIAPVDGVGGPAAAAARQHRGSALTPFPAASAAKEKKKKEH